MEPSLESARSNSLANAAAYFTILNNVKLCCDEFNWGTLPQSCLDAAFKDQLGADVY